MAQLKRAVLASLLALLAGCGRSERMHAVSPSESPTVTAEPLLAVGEGPRELLGLPNVCRVSEKLLSGGLPAADEGFGTLKALGVRTVISVDGARPDVERARKFDMRYVHLPIGYDGVPRDQGLRLARAVRDLPGLVYVHCHHGQHRSPAAAIAVQRCLDAACSTEEALAFLKRAGTAPSYKGLYSATSQFTAISSDELDRVSADFPEVAELNDFVKLMVEVERRFDRLKKLKEAGWKMPAKHPDLDAPHEALLLREAYTELARLPEARQRGEELHRSLIEASAEVQSLENALAAGKSRAADAALAKAGATCGRCHSKHRDVPKK
jgi:protein tyrosine phosphatase (PTP) superfamily phosphohydrolase (DUF442 family)